MFQLIYRESKVIFGFASILKLKKSKRKLEVLLLLLLLSIFIIFINQALLYQSCSKFLFINFTLHLESSLHHAPSYIFLISRSSLQMRTPFYKWLLTTNFCCIYFVYNCFLYVSYFLRETWSFLQGSLVII